MKNLLIAAAAVFAFATAAHAGEIKFPSDQPVASITIPDDWGPKETETGVDATSPDDAVYLSVDVAEPKDTTQVVKDAVGWLQGQGVNVDAKTQKESQDKLNGRDIFFVEWSGTDKDGPVSVGLAALVLSPETVLVFTYWGTKGDEDKNQPAIGAILNSVQPAG